MEKPLRFLTIDDEPAILKLVSELLKREFPEPEIVTAGDAETLAKHLEASGFDLVITDYQLWWTNGLEVLAEVKKRYPKCPVIMFTGSGSEELAVEAMKSGLEDYIIKTPKHLKRLTVSAKSALERAKKEVEFADIRKSREFLDDILNVIDNPVFVKDEQLRYFLANDATCKLAGVPREDLLGKTDFNFLPKKIAQKIREVDEKVFKTGRTMLVEEHLDVGKGLLTFTSHKSRFTDPATGRKYLVGVAHDITERLKNEQALKESESRYRTLIESAEDHIFQINDSMVILSMNSSAARALGDKRSKLVGLKVKDIFPPPVAARFEMSLREVFSTAKGLVRESTMIVGERQRWINTRLSPITDDKDRVVSVLGVTRDITDRKQMEDALRESEIHYRALFEDSPISLWEQDFSEVKRYIDRLRESGTENIRAYFDNHPEAVTKCASLVKLLNINKTTLEIYGAASIEDFRDGLNTVFTDKSLAVFKEELLFFFTGGTMFEDETESITLRGEKRHTLIRACVAPGYEKTLKKVLVSVVDITERKRVESTMLFLSSITKQTKDAIIVTDEAFKITYMNEAAEELYGYTLDDLKGKIPVLLNVEPIAEAIEKDIKKTVSSGKVWTGSHRHRRKDGSTFICEFQISPLLDIQERIYSYVSVQRNITDRRRLEAELLNISAREQRRIGQDLHDGLGQQLTGIAYMIKAMEQKLVSAGLPEAAEAAELAELIKETVARTRILSQGLCPVEMDDQGLVSSLEKLVGQTVTMHDISCRFICLNDIRITNPDKATHLFRIAQEAITNAVKHARPKTINVRLELNKDNVIMTIEDDGLGIPDSYSESEGMGIRIMRYRANSIGATFAIRESGGTEISCSLPMEKLAGQGSDYGESSWE